MVSPGKFNAMREKALKELYSFIRKNSDLIVQNEEKDEVGEDYLFLTYLNRGINLPSSNDDEIAIYLNETRISSPNSIENHAESYFTYWIQRREVYPSLCPLALSLMYTKSSSVDVERLFSQARYVLERRGKMKANTFNILMRLKHNFQLFGLSSNNVNTVYDDRYLDKAIDVDDKLSPSDSDTDTDDLWEL
ncbi:hypothetical protein C6P45_002199 [Maudiozyma exigua]|uniref:HAT C-terminal dimerisation domain-containing protein n=1 Tax=Maudiozyma exigua TaxID=34358 RepID=A0A9P7B4P2_MAUEX|nr:hypothetical protein C6P45_002199 [Kazachstania exigua]